MPTLKTGLTLKVVSRRVRWIIAIAIFAGVAFSTIAFRSIGTTTVSAQVTDDQIAAPEATTVITGNLAPITIIDNAPASLYPSVATVSVLNTSITRVRVQLNGFAHTFPDDVDIILEGPQGQRAMVMSDAGGGGDVSDVQLTFDSAAPLSAVLPDSALLTTGDFRAANYGNTAALFTDTFPAPFPAPNTLTDAPADLSVFHQTNPNGTWRLYVVDDAGTDVGTISGGWTLLVTVPTIFTVNSTNEPGNGVCDASECTLREAITAAINATGNSDQISFDSSFNTPKTIDLLTPLPDITESMAIAGPGANLLTVRRSFTAATDFRIFRIPFGITTGVAISGMTITGGQASGVGNSLGGGIFSQSNLTLNNVHVTGNQASSSGGGVGLSNADGVFTGCTFSGNAAPDGGGITFDSNGRTLRLASSTVSGNRAATNGGGIEHRGAGGNGRLEVVNSTIADNTAGNGGGIRTLAGNAGVTSTTTLRNTIIAGNTSSNLAIQSSGGAVATCETLGFNLSDNYNGVFTPLASDITSPTPLLGPLSLGGGTTPTHALLGGSPAINAGDASGQAVDQRGQPRVSGSNADIGAVEMQSLVVNSTANAGTGSLRNILSLADANPSLNDIIFDPAVFNTAQTIMLTSGELPINSNVTINGAGANLLTVRRDAAAADFRVFTIPAGVVNGVAISGMTIAGGRAPSGVGGGIISQSNLTLTNVHVTGNQAGAGGGVGLAAADGVFTNCTFSNNTATNALGTGGGIYHLGNGGRTLRVVGSTVSGNSSVNNGGGISNFGVGSNSRLEVVGSTIANNTGVNSGGILTRTQGSGAGTTVTTTLRSTIIAGNTPNNLGTETFDGGAATFQTLGFNLASDNGGGFLNVAPITTDKINANAGLAPLVLSGGTTPTRALLFGSEALDAGNSSGATSDQRGSLRPVDLAGITNVSDAADIGAFEAQTAPAAPPTISINDVSQNEGNSGATEFSFIVSLSAPSAQNVSVSYQTANGTATAPADYTAINPTFLPFSPGEISKQVFITVNGDTTFEPNETFFVNLLDAMGATIADGQGQATIQNDDAQPTISINDVSQAEGNSGTTAFTFNMTLSNASSQTVTVRYQSADGTATTVGNDYTGISSITPLPFNPGETSKQLTVFVNGDITVESNETFFLNLFDSTGATISDNQGLGTIINDDGACTYTLSPASPQNVPATSSNLNVNVTAQAGCAWTATTSTPWITINSGTPGNGSGTVNMTFAANTGTARSGSLTVAGQTYTINQAAGSAITIRAPFDYDGDNKTDVSIFRPAPGEWWVLRSTNGGNFALQFGNSSDKLVPADYTGDGKTDVAFWRPSTGFWFVLRSEDFSFFSFPFGSTGDVPVPADYDGDGKADAAVFRESSLTWFISKSTGGTDIIGFGSAGDKPVVADYDGDRKADIAIFRPTGATGPGASEWWVRRSSNASVFALQFGSSTDKAVQGDYTGDGKADVAFWRPSNGNWFILRSEDFSFFAFPFGASGDVPVSGDYDADGRSDAGVFRPSSFTWFIQRSTVGTLIQSFGIAGDVPTPSAYIP